jgi:hypothetical protein
MLINSLFKKRSSASATLETEVATSDVADSAKRESISALALAPLAAGAIMLTASRTAEASGSHDSGKSISILAPKDGYVSDTAPSGKVSQSAMIVAFDSDEEDRAIARINQAKALLSDQTVTVKNLGTERSKALAEAVGSAQSYNLYVTNMRRWVEFIAGSKKNTDLSTGKIVTPNDVLMWRAAETRASTELTRAYTAEHVFNQTLPNTVKQLDQLSAALDAELQAVSSAKSRLVVNAPFNANVVLQTYKGAFVTKGTIVALLTEV